ncbi:MAG: ATP synthase F1 subunit epsilon [Planctomycetota bacterium]
MAGELRLLVITPERAVMDEKVTSVVLPGSEGSFGVLKNHAPLLAAVEAGELVVTDAAGNRNSYFVADGFVEIRDNTVRLVVDAGEPVKDIDLARAEESERRARARLAHTTKVDSDLPRAEAALRRAIQREKLAKKYKM